MENLELFGDVEAVELPKMTRRSMNAIKWLMGKGYRPQPGGFRNLSKLELVNKDTAEVEVFDINQVLAEYDQERHDEARARAAAKRMEQNSVSHH